MHVILRFMIAGALAGLPSAPALADGLMHLASGKRQPQSQCARVAVQAVGDPKISQAWAQSEAWKQWRQAVRSSHGEQYMDRGAARNITVRCTDSGVSGLTKRCTVSALPCLARPL